VSISGLFDVDAVSQRLHGDRRAELRQFDFLFTRYILSLSRARARAFIQVMSVTAEGWPLSRRDFVCGMKERGTPRYRILFISSP